MTHQGWYSPSFVIATVEFRKRRWTVARNAMGLFVDGVIVDHFAPRAQLLGEDHEILAVWHLGGDGKKAFDVGSREEGGTELLGGGIAKRKDVPVSRKLRGRNLD